MERISLARPQTRSVLCGFRLWGIVDEPTWSCRKGSNISDISVLWRFLISLAILSRVPATRPKTHWSSARRSLWTTWLAMSTGSSPRRSMVSLWTSNPLSPKLAMVPTAPLIFPTRRRPRAASSLSRCRATSLAQMANFIPYVMGTACCPWVLPMVRVSLWSSACLSRTPRSSRRSPSIIARASLSWRARAVSSVS
ncbi:hypothetical protein ES707_16277 [subsurface metagenome]